MSLPADRMIVPPVVAAKIAQSLEAYAQDPGAESTLKEHNLEPLFVDFGGATLNFDGSYKLTESARRFENFETSYASRIGLGIAVDYALEVGFTTIEKRVGELSAKLRGELKNLPEITLHDDGPNQSGIITFSTKKLTPYQFSSKISEKGINVSTARKEFAVDLNARKIDSIIRASLHYYNSEKEVERFIEETKNLMKI
ncbi:MAG: aminotransferase class V-fold PLP-dependent enzyme [Bdellovibrionales bacterium]|nr:aminotransferase class V-fold PLP-dependent enzyme [Bdellovibrionales bacterium]